MTTNRNYAGRNQYERHMCHYCKKKALRKPWVTVRKPLVAQRFAMRVVRKSRETLRSALRQLCYPEVGTEDTEETLCYPEIGTEDTEETLSYPNLGTEGTEKTLGHDGNLYCKILTTLWFLHFCDFYIVPFFDIKNYAP